MKNVLDCSIEVLVCLLSPMVHNIFNPLPDDKILE